MSLDIKYIVLVYLIVFFLIISDEFSGRKKDKEEQLVRGDGGGNSGARKIFAVDAAKNILYVIDAENYRVINTIALNANLPEMTMPADR